ncbi:MAG: extracellular solute-binding protein [Spirochaetales bacterium]|nr:extracellular solute-binding protein [Spirochaetales bacterium]
MKSNSRSPVLWAVSLLLLLSGCYDHFGPQQNLSVELFDRDTPGLAIDDGYQAHYIMKKIKKSQNISLSFVPVPRWEEVPKLNALMTAQKAPDLCFLYDIPTISNYIKSESLADLGPALKKYGSHLKEYLGEDLLKYGCWNGIQYTIPAKRPLTPAFSSFIRKDWLDKLGLGIPTTKQEFYEALVAFRDKNPGKVENPIPFGIQIYENIIDWNVHTLVWSFVEKMSEEEFASKYDQGRWVMPGYKEGFRFLNRLYHEKLINLDFDTDKTGDLLRRHQIQGLVGAWIGNYDLPYRSDGVFPELKKNVADGEIIPFDPFENYEGKHVKMKYSPAGLHMFVPSFNKNQLEAVIKYLDWMASDKEILKILQNGEIGIHYKTVNADGIPIQKVSNDDLPLEYKINWHDFAIISTGAFDYGDDALNMKAQAMNYPGFEKYIVRAMEIAYTDAFLAPYFDVVIESEAKYSSNLKSKSVEIFIKSITAEPDNFDKVYDKLVVEYMDLGARAIIDEKIEVFRAMKAAEKKTY